MKCGIQHGEKCRIDSNTCCTCGKLGHMMKDCPNRKSKEQGKETVQPNGPSEESPRR